MVQGFDLGHENDENKAGTANSCATLVLKKAAHHTYRESCSPYTTSLPYKTKAKRHRKGEKERRREGEKGYWFDR
jgi:hypothetical protein